MLEIQTEVENKTYPLHVWGIQEIFLEYLNFSLNEFTVICKYNKEQKLIYSFNHNYKITTTNSCQIRHYQYILEHYANGNYMKLNKCLLFSPVNKHYYNKLKLLQDYVNNNQVKIKNLPWYNKKNLEKSYMDYRRLHKPYDFVETHGHDPWFVLYEFSNQSKTFVHEKMYVFYIFHIGIPILIPEELFFTIIKE